jgi:hypothetical protein
MTSTLYIKKKKHCSDTLSKATVPYIWKKQCSDTNVFSVLKKYIIKKLKRRSATPPSEYLIHLIY